MNRFYNRVRELDSLERAFAEPGASLYVLYGRRRLGKTTLLGRFAEGKPGVYHMADRTTERGAIRLLAQSMARSLGEDGFADPEYRSFGDLFEAYDRFRPAEKTYLVLDEYQYLCEAQPALSSILQRHWDGAWRRAPIMVVLCGSLLSMMHRETLARSSPLYGRRSGQWLLGPMRFAEVRTFYDHLPPRAQLEMWALSGGVPRYAELVAEQRSLADALERHVLERDGALYAEARFLLQDEVTTPNVYFGILNAVAAGANRISEIAGRVGLPANQLTRYLSALGEMGLVARHVPVTEKNPAKSKRGIYQLEDAFLRLWFGCVAPFESLLELGRIKDARSAMRERLERHVAFCFENVCRQHVEDRVGELGGVKVGRYWSKHAEIDVVAVDERGDVVLAGECKWSARPAPRRVGEELEQKVRSLWPKRAEQIRLAVFCAGGFGGALERWAKESDAWLVDAETLCL